MSFQPGAALYTQGFATSPENVQVPHIDTRIPASTDILYPIGKRWINKSANTEYVLTSQAVTSGVTASTWTLMATNSGALNTLTGDSGGAISPSANNISLLGTANQITTTGSGSTITWSLPAAITAPGSLTTTTSLASGTTITAGTSITATLGAITATNGNLVFGTAGNKILSTSVATTTTAGANSFGSVTLAVGTATVSTTAVTTNSLIVIWRQGVGASTGLGELTVGTIVNGTSFVVYAATVGTPGTPLATDLSSVGWMIIN